MSEGVDSQRSKICIVQLRASSKDRWHRLMAAAVLATGDRLYVLFDGMRSATRHGRNVCQD